MRIILIVSFLFTAQFSIGQKANDYLVIDTKVAKIPDSLTATTSEIASYISSNFKTENEKVRAIYYWTASNISYDVPNMYEPNYLDSPQEKITNTLKSRKGVCIHYAEVFNDIANKTGIKTYIIGGYTKQDGKIAPISHAWCASKIDGKWFLFDPTWGSGYINGQKFIKKMNNSFYKVEPSKMIASHIPFDYLWQFLNSPTTNQEFISGKMEVNKPKTNFEFEKEIDNYEKLSDGDKAFEASKRIEKNGLLNKMITDYFNEKKKQFTVIRQNKNIEKLNIISADFNQGISYLNDFIMYRNKRFKPTQSDEMIKKMIQDVKDKFTKCKDEVYTIGSVGTENSSNLNSLKRLILEAIDKTKEQEDFVNEYLSKGNLGRKIMFTNLR